MTDAEEIIAELRHKRVEAERLLGYERLPDPPGEGRADFKIWNGNVYAARGGCIWVLDGATWEELKPLLTAEPVMVKLSEDRLGWTLADGESLPPSFPPRKERPDAVD